MKPEDFMRDLHASVIETPAAYDEFYATLPIERARTPLLKEVVALYAGLTSEQRDVIGRLLQQAAALVVYNTLAVLDGEEELPGQTLPLVLKHGLFDRLDGELGSLFSNLMGYDDVVVAALKSAREPKAVASPHATGDRF